MSKQIITSSPDVMGGTPVFAGTRVPVQTLLDYLKAGESIDDFLDGSHPIEYRQVDKTDDNRLDSIRNALMPGCCKQTGHGSWFDGLI